ncbi:hypothetical protein FDJ20_gp105 [Vibrio phage Thalassa]|uniref:Uncharacterized protein n=1 Tax=Vibrio phage Thalassa TaxID=2570301 RepID=A0A2H5BHD2_9CAUD|nr:hypothetical protein FDJ20_gp006 [Vibrio phage Thalassa]YP_009621478.1 hypothetical protein FDJ20_gp105 [Vibrio phage Thalassa]AUG85208.1 hypothetical protein THALASSA_6 [Vibrio phage Thalassa]AUG85397.1 hypothetical protein THALASSA_218 [Vibrio phage Thalassa]
MKVNQIVKVKGRCKDTNGKCGVIVAIDGSYISVVSPYVYCGESFMCYPCELEPVECKHLCFGVRNGLLRLNLPTHY